MQKSLSRWVKVLFICNSREASEHIFTPGELSLLDWNFMEGCFKQAV